jgi:hypothetical protein
MNEEYNSSDTLNRTRLRPHNVVSTYPLNKLQIQKEKSRTKSIYQFPAVRDDALMHQKVNAFGYRSPSEEASKEKSCPCCGYSVNICSADMGSDLSTFEAAVP